MAWLGSAWLDPALATPAPLIDSALAIRPGNLSGGSRAQTGRGTKQQTTRAPTGAQTEPANQSVGARLARGYSDTGANDDDDDIELLQTSTSSSGGKIDLPPAEPKQVERPSCCICLHSSSLESPSGRALATKLNWPARCCQPVSRAAWRHFGRRANNLTV